MLDASSRLYMDAVLYMAAATKGGFPRRTLAGTPWSRSPRTRTAWTAPAASAAATLRAKARTSEALTVPSPSASIDRRILCAPASRTAHRSSARAPNESNTALPRRSQACGAGSHSPAARCRRGWMRDRTGVIGCTNAPAKHAVAASTTMVLIIPSDKFHLGGNGPDYRALIFIRDLASSAPLTGR
eukprot:scaffold30606_cov62-Phaeocystis_antarctica.AAC.2